MDAVELWMEDSGLPNRKDIWCRLVSGDCLILREDVYTTRRDNHLWAKGRTAIKGNGHKYEIVEGDVVFTSYNEKEKIFVASVNKWLLTDGRVECNLYSKDTGEYGFHDWRFIPRREERYL